MTDLFDHSAHKYRSGQVLRTSAACDWTGVAAEHRQHPSVILPANEVRQMEICIATRRDEPTVVTRKSDGGYQESRSEAGMVWLCPVGVVEEEVNLQSPIELLHIYLPTTRFEMLSEVCGGQTAKADSVGYVAGFRDEVIQDIGTRILSEMKFETAGGRVLVDTLALSLTARLAHRYSADALSRPAALRTSHGLDDARLQRVLDYVREHVAEDIGVEELAQVACLSPFHFTRMFRNRMGMPPHRYMAELRLERAKLLLASSNRSLVDIALATCFSSQSNFTRAFRSATGMTPGQYRRSMD